MGDKHEIITRIVAIEWGMFAAVNAGRARADCQEDFLTFVGMRSAQFSAWSFDAAASYLDDLTAARRIGRNLVEEKYIHMMKSSAPRDYSVLIERVPPVSDAVRGLSEQIASLMLGQTRALFADFPHVAGRGRPLYSGSDESFTSVETYQLGELLTYSEKTLSALLRHINELDSCGISLAELILENTVKYYGYTSLSSAEHTASERTAVRV